MFNIIILQYLLLISTFLLSVSANTLVPNQSLTDNNQTIVSEGETFEFGFFSPIGEPKNRYLGIWYKNLSPLTVVWVANRDIPVTDSSGVFRILENGNLLLTQGERIIWSSNQSNTRTPIAGNPITKLLDSGNLVVTAENRDEYIWQSFDHATDTLLPGMKLGWDSETGVNNSLVSWKSLDDPSAGDYSFVMQPYDSQEVYLYQKHSVIYRSGPWNGLRFSGVPEMRSYDGFVFSFFFNENKKYYSFTVNETITSRLMVDSSGKLLRFVWIENGWNTYWDAPKDQCDNYKECGPYGMCNTNDSPVCSCVKGFMPRNRRDWDLRDGSGGCVNKTQFECGKDDGFLKLERMKLPDCSTTHYVKDMNIEDCREMCRINCSCTAYANPDIRDGASGCIIWIGDLVDLREYANGGQELYVRVAASELDKNRKSIAIIITVTVISLAIILGLTAYFIWRKRTQKRNAKEIVARVKIQELPLTYARDASEEHKNDDLELPLIDFDIIAATTENFSYANKLGEGGFGVVYKGVLSDGQQIAVKRLSKNSGQGIEEFKNEVMLIAKLQHRNLVRLLGCCVRGDEKMLIYEYMPNKSLDVFLFDKSKSHSLDWGRRFNIIMGIARGLLYLHRDSRLRIIHRDLKASNILLDSEMHPKISDFGMARIFGSDQTEANTRRVVGTYGYMSPEYAMDGLFSVKSDVFSYGVLMLEIITGTKNRAFYSDSNELNLLGYAWKLWEERKGLELMDESAGEKWSSNEVLKCIQIGLLCVQEHADDRPTISSVLLMLSSETASIDQPKQPGFSLGRIRKGHYLSSNDQECCSANQVTVTMLEGR